ncbi:uncharacterized protein LOC142771397 isoform X2 [Rhipicephalus microplus]|uniref:uncharacterized protein LOC142771397 isoform X2 n=1 Tax=Rhipicephalus microplus TaxID=6941 RepID=UPI003F6B3CE8
MQTELLAAVLVVISTDVMIFTAGLDVTEFLYQSQPIWTYKSTRRGYIRCEVDQIEASAPLSISINRCVVLERRRCEVRVLGVLDAEQHDQMTIFYRGRTVYYDLRVINSSLRRRIHPACKAFFRRVLGNQRPIQVYGRHCQELLRQGT